LDAFTQDKEYQEYKEYRRADRSQNEKPVRFPEQGENDHEVDEIAARSGI